MKEGVMAYRDDLNCAHTIVECLKKENKNLRDNIEKLKKRKTRIAFSKRHPNFLSGIVIISSILFYLLGVGVYYAVVREPGTGQYDSEDKMSSFFQAVIWPVALPIKGAFWLGHKIVGK